MKGGALSIKILDNLDDSNIIIDNCSFKSCVSEYGGAIYIYFEQKCLFNISNSYFYNNRATSIQGGSIYATTSIKSIIEFINCTIESMNNCNSFYLNNLNYSMENCEFNNNRISNPNIETSSTIYSTNSNGILNNCLFNSNSASYNSDSLYSKPTFFTDGNYIFDECKFNNNQAQGYRNSYCGSLCISKSKSFGLL